MADISVDAHARDPFGREVRSLRLSVTQRCDLACPHCHREGQTPSSAEMTPEEIERLVRIGSRIGIRKVKITGGEPLLRQDIDNIVAGISPLVKEVSLTTNGSRLALLASTLRSAGLSRVNVSLHTLDATTYRQLCGRNELDDAVAGIQEAIRSGLNPVKVNMVVLRDKNVEEIDRMISFCQRVGAVLQLIEYESDRDGANGADFKSRYYSLRPLEERCAAMSQATSVNDLHGRRRYRLGNNGSSVDVEFVRPMHNTEFCANCTRIRMSSDGRLKPCLLSKEGEVDVLTSLRKGASDEELLVLFLKAVSNRRPYWR